MFKPVFSCEIVSAISFVKSLGYLYEAFEIREKGTSSKKVILRDEKKDVNKICFEVQKTSDNVGGKPRRGFSLQHKTFSTLQYAQEL